MAAAEISTKRVAINKATAQMVGVVAGASVITIFCLVAAHAVFVQNSYQLRVVSAKNKAHKQLTANIDSVNSLASSYRKFDASSVNSLGGDRNGDDDRSGSNSKIILDALPSSYDFPALTSSLEKILAQNGLQISEIGGTDDQLSQQGNDSSATPKPVEIPFSFTVKHANYDSVQKLSTVLQNSIRPIQIDTINLSGGLNDMSMKVTAHTYFQPAKNLQIVKKPVK